MPIQGGVAVVQPGAKAPPYRVVPPRLELSRPECGIVVGYPPAGCEVCRERPAALRAQPWTKTEPRQAPMYERNRDEKLACEISPSCEAGHMGASDLIKALQNTLQGGGRPHTGNPGLYWQLAKNAGSATPDTRRISSHMRWSLHHNLQQASLLSMQTRQASVNVAYLT
jgi:hypothetical protein